MKTFTLSYNPSTSLFHTGVGVHGELQADNQCFLLEIHRFYGWLAFTSNFNTEVLYYAQQVRISLGF